MPRRRHGNARTLASLTFVGLMLAHPVLAEAAPESTEVPQPSVEPPVPGVDPTTPPPELEPPPPSYEGPTPASEPDGIAEPPPPELEPEPKPEGSIEFSVPPPEEPDEPAERRGPPPVFPDPGMAPDNGNTMLVLSGTTIALTLGGAATGLVVGVRNQVEFSWLLPATIVPTVGLLAFAGGGLYLGIQRRKLYRRWEIGNRVVGLPQGGGLRIGASFALLAALGFVPAGSVALGQGQTSLGAALVIVGGTAAVATPIMFVVAARHTRAYQRTGGWRRRSVPARPASARIELMPLVTPIPRGASVGVLGRF